MSVRCPACDHTFPSAGPSIEVQIYDAEPCDNPITETPPTLIKEYIFHSGMAYSCLASLATHDLKEQTGQNVIIDKESLGVFLGDMQWGAELEDQIEEADVYSEKKLVVRLWAYM
ncbi:hypothetical protein PHISCL_00152 [Aspergillus sclerotialis]|uniref:Uncharacterized protein n=1 Tax=Aspergillus sclerotialis TaxID=2070753 RepID=A0A3A2ZWY9_9EURO|nr:hypothetical protein PHISCL_00152 [Aspergillus sclerotialis]